MWSTVTRQISFSGTVAVAVGGASPALPLRGVLIDVYRADRGTDGAFQFQRLNQAAAQTTITGDFSFSNVPVPVQAQELTPATPPYTPVEFINPASLPTLVFRISADAEVIGGASAGTQLIEVYDERPDVSALWLAAHPQRIRVALSGAPVIDVVVPEGDAEAMAVAGIVSAASSVPGREFHFLRVGRAIRAEIGEMGDSGPDFSNRAGYMTSTNVQATPAPSFFPGVRDAPFGGQLHIGGHFGSDFLTPAFANTLYYTVSFRDYAGSLTSLFDATQLTTETRIEDPLFNKRYLLPTVTLPAGQWQTLNLGPFTGSVTHIEAVPVTPFDVPVYKRPPLPNPAVEYWPFWDLIALWNSGAAPNATTVMTLEAYERIGGTDAAPELRKLNMDPSINAHLPLTIDNRPPVLKLFDWRTGVARFTQDDVVADAAFGPCGEVPVTTPPPFPDQNECILVRYSVEDGAGNPHPHVGSYGLGIQYTPKQVTGAPLEIGLPLRTFLGGGIYDDISGSYSPADPSAPLYTVMNQRSVLVPQALDGWPPEQGGDPTSMGSQCVQYALAVGASCSVRTVDGWSGAFGNPSLNRHIIVRR